MIRALICLIALVLSLGAGSLAAAAPKGERADTYAFIFKDADVSAIAEEILGQNLKVAYRIDPSITTKMTFRIEERLTRAQLLEAFEAALSTYDIVMTRDGDAVSIKPRASAKIGASIHGADDKGAKVGYEVRAIPITYASATEVAKALEATSKSGLVLYSNDKQGLILLGGGSSEIETAVSTIKLFDQSGLSDARIRYFPLTNASAATVSPDLEKILSASGTSGVTIVALKRLNGLFAFAKSQTALDDLSPWVAKLDVASKEVSQSVWTYRPKGAAADALAATLMQTLYGVGSPSGASSSSAASGGVSASAAVTGSSAPAAAVAPVGGASASQLTAMNEDGVRISGDKDSNTLIVIAPEATRVKIQRILSEIDREPMQILIEASIVEVDLTDDWQFGVDWSSTGVNGQFTINSINSSSGTVAAQAPGFSATFLNSSIKAAINALSSKSNVQVMSAPKIATLENHTAKLDIGDQVPVITQSATSTVTSTATLVNTVDYRNTGVILNVTPRISGDDRIVMTISQEVSSVAPTQTSGIDSPTISQRKMESTLIVPDGVVVALGGLISSTRSKNVTGTPGLQNIPYLGALFRTRSDNLSRTELIVLLKARILRGPAENLRLLDDLAADMKELRASGALPKGK